MNADLYFICTCIATTCFMLFGISMLFSWFKAKENRQKLEDMDKRLSKAESAYAANSKSLCTCADGVNEVKDQLNLVHARLIQKSVDGVNVRVKGGNVNTGQQVIKDED